MARPPAGRQRILVAGLGNLLLADDGVGVHAVRGLMRSRPRGVTLAEVGTAVLDALHLFERADRILAIDAMRAGGPPGTIYRFRLHQVEDPISKASLHDFGLRSVLGFLAVAHPPEVVVLGVEPQSIEYNLDLSPPVRAAVPRLLGEARAVIRSWRE
jgi:hydrogenase maturation protease